jgi:hypothetical protein
VKQNIIWVGKEEQTREECNCPATGKGLSHLVKHEYSQIAEYILTNDEWQKTVREELMNRDKNHIRERPKI